MAQVIDRTVGANPTGFDMRTELNNIIAALESDNSGSSEPLNPVAYMKWLDTSNATYYYYKERNHDNTAWVTLFRYTVATKVMEVVNNGVVLQDSALVHKTGNETIEGVKTFSSSPLVPLATTGGQAIRYDQSVKLTGDETIEGVKTFSSTIAGNINGNADTANTLINRGGFPKADGQDFNTLTTTGVYFVQSGNYSVTLNSPGDYGTLFVNNAYPFTSQLYIAYSEGTIRTRAAYNSNWSGWSSVKTALNATGSAPIYACRAWVNFKGTGTVAIRASGNVSSITDGGVGDYTINFTTAMPDANYACIATYSSNFDGSDGVTYIDENNYAAASIRLCSLSDSRDSYPLTDRTNINVAIFR